MWRGIANQGLIGEKLRRLESITGSLKPSEKGKGGS
jgi:hypothetical protein